MDSDGENKRQLTSRNMWEEYIVYLVNKVNKITYLRSVLIVCLILISCNDNSFKDDNGNGITPGPVYPEIDQYPSWSPDSNEIVFSRKSDESVLLWIIEKDGSNLRRLTY